MRLTPLCTPSLIVYCLYRPTDSSRCTRGCHVFYPLRLAVFFLVFFFKLIYFFRFKIFGCRIFVTDFRDARLPFSAERRQALKQNSTLFVCEICASKWLFLLATKIVSKYHRIYHVNRGPCAESHVGGCSDAPQTTATLNCLSAFLIRFFLFFVFFYSSRIKKCVLITVARARNGNVR